MTDENIEKRLRDRMSVELKLLHFDSIDSTNQFAKKLSQQQSLQIPYLIWADQQTAGTGKLARPFYSSTGGLYLSLILPDQTIAPQKIGLFTTSLAVASIEAMKECFNVSAQVKWVNDIYVNQRKVAGILVEQAKNKAVIVGIGVNLFQPVFPQAIEQTAGNLLTSPPTSNQIEAFLVSLVSHLYQSSLTYPNGQFISEYKRHLNIMNQVVELQIGRSLVRGEVIDINNFGQLVIIDSATSQTRSIQAGEVIKVRPDHLAK